jgi:dienelactone hydrolase
MHGCSGAHDVERGWEAALAEEGYASFMVNSLGGRGLSGACIDAGALFPAQRIADAYGALRILSTNPLIDRQRIALMGFSHGGIVTTMSATTRTKQVFVLPAQPSFRAFARSTLLQLDLSGNVAALRASPGLCGHSGALDDWTPAKPCEQMVARLPAAGYDAEIAVYRNARHSFDDGGQGVTFLPQRPERGGVCPARGQHPRAATEPR